MSDVISGIFSQYKYMDDKIFYVYILLTEKNTLYCGYTDDVLRRFELHKSGKGAKYTRANKPVKIVYTQKFETKSEALKAEMKFKKLTRKKKTDVINGYLTLAEL